MMGKTIFIFEYISSGGFHQAEIPPSLFCEGFAMLRTITEDFHALNFEVHLLLDYRISHLSFLLKSTEIRLVEKHDNFLGKYKERLNRSDFCFIIAPEFSNILYKLTEIAMKTPSTVLSMGLKAIKLGASKLETYKFFQINKINTPQTWSLPLQERKMEKNQFIKIASKVKGPFIIKPEDGVGAESIHYFNDVNQLRKNYAEFEKSLEGNRNHVIQEYIPGRDLSASLIGFKEQDPLILSVNSQIISFINETTDSEYLGGYTPIKKLKGMKKELNKIIPELVQVEFQGYFGLDFILNNKGQLSYIEINPRLTTSYIGLRNIMDINPVRFILDSILEREKKDDFKLRGHSNFLRLEVKSPHKLDNTEFNGTIIPNLLRKIPEIVTPPITFSQFQDKIIYSLFIATKTRNKISSDERINKIIKVLKQYDLHSSIPQTCKE